jgi:16S rRNA (adenine1518-N6/adenine1519-N6)-dimethyltransferase
VKSRAKKRLGQHFLRDTRILDRLLRLIGVASADTFLEVGAGYGALSERLAPRVAHLIAVELDLDCVSALEASLARFPSATVVAGDILSLKIPALVSPYLRPGQPLRVAGNLPYNIATTIIEKLLSLELSIRDITAMVQLEVAQRIVARRGTRQYGYFSVYCQHLAQVRLEFEVAPGCFSPRPQVISAVVTFRPHPRPRELTVTNNLVRIAKAAFGHRRKTLANSLRHDPQIGLVSDALLTRARIDPGRRAEDLTIQEFERLATIYACNFNR